MPAPEPPVIDPRDSADLAQELSRQARVDMPGWHPPHQGDPWTTLHQALATMVAHLVERVNRVPTHAFRTFLQAAGIQTLAPRPARAAVTFRLAAGRSSIVVPAGTRVEAPEEGGRGPVVFETDADLTVLPVRLDVTEVWDPLSDRITTVGPAVDAGFSAFTGVDAVRHDLLVTSPSLESAEPGSHVSLRLQLGSSLGESELADLVSTLSLELADELGRATTLASTVTEQHTGTSVTLEATATSTGVPNALHLVIDGTLAEHPFSADYMLESAQLDVTVDPRTPSAVAVDGAPVDPSLAFAALGEVPRAGSELAVADPVLGVTDATVRLDLVLDPGVAKNTVLLWEWYDGTSWHPLAGVVTDGTNALTQSGTVTIHSPGVPTSELRGSPGCWVRVRLVSGGYGRPRAYVPVNPDDLRSGLKVEPGTGDLVRE